MKCKKITNYVFRCAGNLGVQLEISLVHRFSFVCRDWIKSLLWVLVGVFATLGNCIIRRHVFSCAFSVCGQGKVPGLFKGHPTL